MGLFSYFLPSGLDFVLTCGVIGSTTLIAAAYFFQRKLIYVASFPPGSRTEVWKPSRFGLEPFEEVSLTTADGIRLTAYYIPASTSPALKGLENVAKCPTIYYLHSNAGNIGHRLPIAQNIHARYRCNIFMLSYRGYGLSEGSPSEKGLRLDAQAGLDYLTNRQDLDTRKIVLYGQSIGGAVALDLLSRNPYKIAAVMLENTFTSLPKVVPHAVPLLGLFASLCSERWESEARLCEFLQKFKTNDESGKISLPSFLFLSSRKDEIIPKEHMDRLYEIVCEDAANKATNERVDLCQFFKFEHATHNDCCVQEGYFEAVVDFLVQLFPATQ